jgi:hypothetical protein
MATSRQNEEFIKTLMPQWPLDEAIEWIKANLGPGDVFEETDLFNWARENARAPEDVFGKADLEAWAEDAGYRR